MKDIGSTIKIKACFLAAFFLLTTLGLATLVLSMGGDESRAVNPPNAPKNPTPPNNAKGLVGDSINLLWQLDDHYRGDHKEIDQSWVKVSTEGPVYSDQAVANVYNGAVSGTSVQISIQMGLTYYWAVKCHDEDGWGPYSDWKFSTNAYPVAKILSVKPNPAREGVEMEFSGKGEDPVDGDAIVEYEWRSSQVGEKLSDKSSFTYDGLSTGTHEITLRVRDNKGLWSQITDDSTKNVKVNANNPPTEPGDIQPVETHSLTPDISWYPSQDEEGDEITYHLKIGSTYQGADIVDTTTTQSFYYLHNRPLKYSDKYTNGKSEKTYFVEIKADDGFNGESNTVEHRFAVVNHQPTAPTITITPEEPSISQDLKLEIEEKSQDPDGDGVKNRIEWYLDDKIDKHFEDDYSIPKNRLEAGQHWEVRVIPNDGLVDGVAGTIEVEILNTPPEIKISSPVEGLVIDSNMELLLDASNTTDIDPKDDTKLSFEWRSDRDGVLESGEKIVHKSSLSVGVHEITVTVSDGINTVEKKVTIVVEEPKIPKITASILPLDEETLYVGDVITIKVLLKNEGSGAAKDIFVLFYNDKNTDFELQPAEKIGDRTISKLDVHETITIPFGWTVDKNPNNLLVQVNGKDMHSQAFKTTTYGSTGDVTENPPSSPDSTSQWSFGTPPEKKSGFDMSWWLWIVVVFIVVVFLGGVAFLIYYKVSSYEDEEFEDDVPEYGQTAYPGYGDPYANELQQQLLYLQNLVSTYLPQYGSYAFGPGAYPALPPAGSGGSPTPRMALPPGPRQPYQTYAPQPFYNPFQTQVSQAPLALPPAPSDMTPGGEYDAAPGGPGRAQINQYAGYSQYSPTSPSPGAFQPMQPEYSTGMGPSHTGFSIPGGWGAPDDRTTGYFPGAQSVPPSPSIPPFTPPPRSMVGEVGGNPGDEMPKNALERPLYNDAHYKGPGVLPLEPENLDIIKPKPSKPTIITPKILCHICRAPIKVTTDERPFITNCDSCGAAVEVSE